MIEATIRPFFGHLRAAKLTTEKLKEFRKKRTDEGRSASTSNRELSILRTALNRGRKCTPPKVLTLPYFPMVAEPNIRQGFLADQQYAKLRDALPEYLRPLFVAAYCTGVRLGELLSSEWRQVDWEQGFSTLDSERTKSGHPPSRSKTCEAAEVPTLKFHDLRRTVVRNMRRAGVAQVVRMRSSGHRTDSMERHYNMVETDVVRSARELMQRRAHAEGPEDQRGKG